MNFVRFIKLFDRKVNNYSDTPINGLARLYFYMVNSQESLHICACIGEHVKNTSEIGQFKIISSDYIEGKLRIRFKLENCTYTD